MRDILESSHHSREKSIGIHLGKVDLHKGIRAVENVMGQAILPNHAAQDLQKRKLHGKQAAAQFFFLCRDTMQKPCHGRRGPAVSAAPEFHPIEAAGFLIPDVMEKPCPRVA